MVVGVPAAPVQAASPSVSTPALRDSRAYVFSVGILTRVEGRSITLRFDDGQTETFTLDASTTIRTQNGDEQTLADLKVGNTVLVIAEERSPVAVSVVNGGQTGFHEASPADIRGHEDDECADCGG